MSETSTPYTTASTSTTVAGNETLTLADEVKKYDTEGLISFFRERDLGLDEDDEKIIHKQKINGSVFLKTSKEEYMKDGLARGPATNLADFAKEIKDKKLRSKKDLSEPVGKDKAVTLVNEIVPISHTAKLSYRDVLVGCTSKAVTTGHAESESKSKGTVSENNNEGNLVQELERLDIDRPYEI